MRRTGHLDRNEVRLDGGSPEGLPGTSAAAIDPARLPETRLDGRCKPLWPQNSLPVNTVFRVLHAHGLRTVWIDKHPAYDNLNAPGGPAQAPGRNSEDFFAPEVHAALTRANLALRGPGTVRLTDPRRSCEATAAALRLYDGLKLHALLNEVRGLDHAGTRRVGTPALFGMNCLSGNLAEKHPWGGDLDTSATPSPARLAAFECVDRGTATSARR